MKCYYCGKADCTEHPPMTPELTVAATGGRTLSYMCVGCGLLSEEEPTVVPRVDGNVRCNDCAAKVAFALAKSGAMPAVATAIERFRENVRIRELEERIEGFGEEVGQLEHDNEELRTINDMLKGELRAYEPSDATMYRLHDYHAHCQAASTLLHCLLAAAGTATVPDALVTQTHAWLELQSKRFTKSPVYPLPEPQMTVLALRTVIDEARRLFDEYLGIGEKPSATVMLATLGAWQHKVEAWRDKVLVKETREALAEPYATLNQRLQEAIDANVRLSVERALDSGQIAVDSKRDTE
jgi:hypothetical protein